jgi:SLOG-like protein
MNAKGPIFLSASVPVEGRQGYETCEPYLIKEAVSALVEVVLGRNLLVWGGQPAITPMIWEAAKQYDVPYQNVVQLYQSKYFLGHYPEENIAFPNYVETEIVEGNRGASLLHMRRRMLSDHKFSAAVFIGGMEGVLEEYEIFQELNPLATVIPVPSPGGVSRDLFSKRKDFPEEFGSAIDYSFWFYKLLGVDLLAPRTNILNQLN